MASQARTNVIINAASGNTTVVDAVAGHKIRVLSYVLVGTGSQTAKFQSSTTTDLTGAMSLIAGNPVVAEFQREGHFETASGELLNLATSASTAMGHLTYALIPA